WVEKLQGAPVVAHDIRAGAAVVCAGLAAHGTSRIDNLHPIDRGYENLTSKLGSLGADISRVI
ncbi:MAG: UDP-N-acetylglucosamine 1-carboxyvinyltransferase, partial [Actinobacteria bacterium ATB1]|nr:UDP-N-acetylglucosamine 1-carboxyvinyltransferase [Actinobacteria bacterium ATB1]